MKKLWASVYRLVYVCGGAVIAYYGIYWAAYSLHFQLKGAFSKKNIWRRE